MTIQSINASLAASFANPSTDQGTDMKQSTQVVVRAPVFQSSIAGFSVYYAGKAHKFGQNKAAAQAFMATCKAPVAKTAPTQPVDVYQNADGSPTPRAQVDILAAENADLRQQLAMAKSLNAKMSAPKDFSALASDLREGLAMMDARKGSRTHKDGVVAINSIACILSNNS
jgi:hypothetical protein